MNENKIKNKNKAIILVIIMLIILTLSTTIAYFTASSTKNTENIVATNNIQLNYTDNKNLMKGELIPVSYEDAKSFFTSEETCIYTDNSGNKFNACSIYEFSIKNTSDVAQKLVISLNPTVNTFTNLNYILYKVEGENNTEISNKELTKNSLTSVNLLNGNSLKENITEEAKTITLNSNETATYKILFFIKNIGEDQTAMDAGKSFGAGIRVDSITTGQYITKTFGESCWTTELIENTENEYKLTAFSGIDHTSGDIDESCTGYVEMDENNLYSVYIPSNVGGQTISIIGNNLFNAISEIDEVKGIPIFNKYQNVKSVTISEGIKEIESGDLNNNPIAPFLYIGLDIGENGGGIMKHTLEVKFTDKETNTNDGSLKTIGNYSFAYNTINSINIPRSVETIGMYAFGARINDLSSLVFEGATDDSQTGRSLLKYIGEDAFSQFEEVDNTKITSLAIPSSVTYIGHDAFENFKALKSVTFGTVNSPSRLEYLSGFGSSGLTSITIPASVKTIGISAFEGSQINSFVFEENSELITIENYAFSYNRNLQSITIPSTVTSIGEQAFSYCNLTYGESNPLEIPSTVTSIGNYAFYNNPNLTHIRYLGSYSASNWYDSGVTTIIKE